MSIKIVGEFKMSNQKKVGVVGAGMMGAEIALCYAVAGCKVVMNDISMDFLNKGKANQEKALERNIKRGRWPEDKKNAMENITLSDKIEDLKDVEFVLEAVSEVADIKKSVLSKVDEVCGPDTVIATNTSSMPIAMLSSYVSKARAAKFVGMHFFSPASVMKLVEVIPCIATTEETSEKARAYTALIDKTPIMVKDVAGFAMNRIYHAIMQESGRLVSEGVCSVEDIDIGCKLAFGHPMGPFELYDLTSLDLNLKVQEILYGEYGDRFLPSIILKRMVEAGLWGRKVGEGFYKYDKK